MSYEALPSPQPMGLGIERQGSCFGKGECLVGMPLEEGWLVQGIPPLAERARASTWGPCAPYQMCMPRCFLTSTRLLEPFPLLLFLPLFFHLIILRKTLAASICPQYLRFINSDGFLYTFSKGIGRELVSYFIPVKSITRAGLLSFNS